MEPHLGPRELSQSVLQRWCVSWAGLGFDSANFLHSGMMLLPIESPGRVEYSRVLWQKMFFS